MASLNAWLYLLSGLAITAGSIWLEIRSRPKPRAATETDEAAN